MPSRTSGGLVKFSVAITPALKAELQAIANERHLSVNAVIVDFIERGKAEWLDEQEYLRERRGVMVEARGAA